MTADLLLSDDILDPISPELPAGADLRWTPEWDRIREARRADDSLDPGAWVKKERKLADWVTVREMSIAALKERSKDLQLALWLTEAETHLRAFSGLRDGLRITAGLMVRYWDLGLFPAMEEGPEDRAGPIEWLNSRLADVITALPITVRADGGQDYSFNDLKEARRVGSEAGWRKSDGDVDEARKKAYDSAVAEGRVSMELFDGAVKATRRAAYEEFSGAFEGAVQEFRHLEKTVDQKFGDAAPALSDFRNALEEIRIEVEKILAKKRVDEPDAPAVDASAGPENTDADNRVTLRLPLSVPDLPSSGGVADGYWQEAETLVRSGQVDKGLARMVQLAAKETTGRNRFQRRLLLAQACLASGRPRLARSILEELAEQIDKLQLDTWESTETIASVWMPLYRLYRQDDSDGDKAQKLYERLCRLDPWQALGCGEG